MADYRQSTVNGQAWTRAYSVTLLNPFNETSTGIFHEETVVSIGDGKHVKQSIGSCSDTFTAENASEAFSLVNPATGDVIGSATYQDVYVLMSSLYLHVALKRDAAELAMAEAAALAEAARLEALATAAASAIPVDAAPAEPPAEV